MNLLLGSLVGGLGGLVAGQSVGEVARQARTSWDGQTPMAKGAIAGGLIGLLCAGNARRLATAGVQIGGAALIGGLAMKAYAEWKGSRDGDGLPADDEEFSQRLLQAMVAAAKADGTVTDGECAMIEMQLARLGLAAEAQALIAAELAAPLDVGRIAALARTPQEAAAIYTASLLVVNRGGAAERGYLTTLAARLGLEDGLVRRLELASLA
jgi:uncharacterized membrane protein YebE (DUF533 family)